MMTNRRQASPRQKGKRGEAIRAIKNIVGTSKRFYWAIGLAAFLVLCSVVISIYSPQVLKQMTNAIAAGAGNGTIDLAEVGRCGMILAGLYLGSAILTYGSSFLLTGVTQKYANQLRKSIIEKINKIPLAYFDSRQVGDILSRVTNDVDSIAQSLDQTISMLLQAAFMLIGSLIGMFCTSWIMALTAMVSLPLMALFLTMIMKLAMPQFVKRQEQIGMINGAVEEKFSGQLVIKLFDADERENAKFEEKNQTLGKTMFRAQFFGGLMQPLMQFISYFAYIAVMVVGGVLMIDGGYGVSFGTITAFLVYVRLFQQPMTQIAQAMNTLQTTTAASKRVFDFLEEKELSDESSKKRVFPLVDGKPQIRGEVEFRHVHFSYDPSREIVHDFSAKFDGTMRENIIYNSKDVSDEELKEIAKQANIYYLVRTLPGKFDCHLDNAGSISAGQKQLLTIARAMVRKSPLLILDEATSNVDTRTEELVQEAMDNLTKGRTSFVIAHRLSTIKNADLILVMRDGNVVEQGTHESLMAQNGFYASLYNSQFSFE